MFKLISIAVLALSVSALPLLTSASTVDSVDMPSFDETYVSPEIESLSECAGAELPVFFHGEVLTSHSAQYVSEGILASLNCDAVTVQIVPVVSLDATDSELEMSVAQVTELKTYLEATGTESEIQSPRLVTNKDSLHLNGRAAIIQISDGELVQS